jgi:hypothetical protein|tara:strand:+ start:908 stop:1318 length:411 start_codon:yes stop_codon:yes gene_type:complete
MGTRSNTVVYDEYFNDGSSVQILNLYRQHDGYTDGHGAELLAFLEPMTIVNGITTGLTNIANGSGCLAAQLVAHFKKRVGDFYIMPPLGEENENDYTYKIYVSGGPEYITMEVWEYDDLIFSGNVSEFKKFIEGTL